MDIMTIISLVAVVAYPILEYWFGETKKVEENSFLALVFRILGVIKKK